MDEASSKFVDNFAIEKVLNEKLAKVNHSPYKSLFVPEKRLFQSNKGRFKLTAVKNVKNDNSSRCFEIPSFESSLHYCENNSIYLHYYPAKKPMGNIVLLHGLFDDNMFNYAFLIRLLNELNLNVYFMTLPYHFRRKPHTSLFSGEFFLSADIYRTQNAFKQAVYDIDASLQFIRNENSLPNILVGFSMGGCISFRYHILKNQEVGTFLINPVTNFSSIIWDNPLLVPVHQDLKKSGFDSKMCEELFRELDPCKNLSSNFSDRGIAMAYSSYDQIIDENKYRVFIRNTGIKRVYTYHAGHLNILRVPKLSRDIFEFFESLGSW